MNWAHLHVARNRKAKKRLPYSYSPEVKWLRYGVWVLFVVAIVTLIVVVILAWKNGRTYCNTICPVGTTLSFFSRFAMFRPVIDTEKASTPASSGRCTTSMRGAHPQKRPKTRTERQKVRFHPQIRPKLRTKADARS